MKFKRKDKLAKDALSIISYFQYFQITDLLAFGKLLGVEEQEDFEDYLTEITLKYTELSKREKDKYLKLAKALAGKTGGDMKEVERLREIYRSKLNEKLNENSEKVGD